MPKTEYQDRWHPKIRELNTHYAYSSCRGRSETDRLTADIRMPDLGIKFHYGRPKWIIVWYPDVNDICSPFVGRARRPFK